MQNKDSQQAGDHPFPPRVLADFGGRRKTYERRLKRKSIGHHDRRDDQDRRSGFDRRGVFPQDPIEENMEKRKTNSASTTTRNAEIT